MIELGDRHPEGPGGIELSQERSTIPQKHGLRKYGTGTKIYGVSAPAREGAPPFFGYFLAKERPPQVSSVLQPSLALSDE